MLLPHPSLFFAPQVKEEVTKFLKADVLLLALLANPGLKERHWDRMAEIVGYSLPHSASSCLNEMLQIGLDAHLEAIEEVCVHASKEYNLEKALARMHQEWDDVTLELKEYKLTYVLRSTTSDEVQALLDEHIVKGQTMQASRFARPLSKQIKEWVDSLILIQDVLEAWLKCQATYDAGAACARTARRCTHSCGGFALICAFQVPVPGPHLQQ